MGTGAITIVMLSSTTEKVFTKDMIIEMLTSNKTLYFGLGTLILIILASVWLKIFDDQLNHF